MRQEVMIQRENIKTFVQHTLGCGCPEEVFQSMDCRSHVRLNDIILKYKMNIGNRLLVYLFETDPESVRQALPFLVSEGKEERDKFGFNRLRIVLTADNVDEVRQIAEDLFKHIEKDEKIHLHIISKHEIPLCR